MNQILETRKNKTVVPRKKYNSKRNIKKVNCKKKAKNQQKKLGKKKFYVTVFFMSSLLLCMSLAYWAFSQYQILQREKFSKNLVSNYSILSLYSLKDSSTSNNNTNNTPSKKQNVLTPDGSMQTILGTIEIPSISVSYPFFSNLTKELLKISPCYFYGAMPPEAGNLCIAGHNYENGIFFSSLTKLKKEDKIYIYDTSHHKYTYSVFDQYEVKTDDLSPLSKQSYPYELTLITCNNFNHNRIITKAYMISKIH